MEDKLSKFDKNKKKKLGEGSNGIVYRVVNKKDNKKYALKIINNHKDLKINIDILKEIKNENIIKYYDYFFLKENTFDEIQRLYIIMEYCKYKDLRQYIEKHKNNNELIDEKEIILIISEICNGLKEIHNKNIIHRDLKPENIFISENFKIKIGDFGIVKNYNSYTKDTFAYMAPEMLQEKPKCNTKVDIWSFGCIIYELCTLEYCFDLNELFELKDIKKVHKEINTMFNNNYSKELNDLINSLLIINYDERPDINEVEKYINKLKKKYNLNNINLKNILNDSKYFRKERNEITIKLIVKSEDENKNIYFLNNNKYGELKELNENNIQMYIDNKKYKFQKYFKFRKGEHYIKLIFKKKIQNCSGMFYECDKIEIIDLSLFNTSEVTDMSEMFYLCDNVKSIILSPSFNTSKVTDMNHMFYRCRNLNNINLSSFDTSKVINMEGMFGYSDNLQYLDLSSFNTSNVTDMNSMFSICHRLKNIILSPSFNTSKITNMSNMFYQCKCLENIDLSSFNTSNVTNMSGMFALCYSLENIDLSPFNTSKVMNMSGMFESCKKLENIDLSSFDTSNVMSMKEMFKRCEKLKNIELSHFNTSKVIDMSRMFMDCKTLENLNCSSFNTSKVINMRGMFYRCEQLTNLDLSSFITSEFNNMNFFVEKRHDLHDLIDPKIYDKIKLSSFKTFLHGMFDYCPKLKNIKTDDINIINEFNQKAL